MIITIAGVPCSGKSTCIEILCEKYGFDSIYTGKLYREEAEKMGLNVLEFNKQNTNYDVDKKIDEMTKRIGTERANDKLIFDSRMAWYFVPNSFKVFLTLPQEEMAKRLYCSNRSESEKYGSMEEAQSSLIERFNTENERYMKLYGVANTNPKNYNLVLDTSNLTPEETADIIYKKYTEFLENKAN